MHAEIISIGTEILMGEIVDTNSSTIAEELPKLGIELRWVSKVGDDPDDLIDALQRATSRSDITFTTGGLGPTSDDLTREVIAKMMDEEMSVQEELLDHLKSLFNARGSVMPRTNVKQATLIPSAKVLPNPIGTAPGWWVQKNNKTIIAMPGPPRELKRMWNDEIAPRLLAQNPGVTIVTRTWKTFGISEGGLNEMIAPLFESKNPYLGIYSKEDGIHLRAIASASTEAEAEALIAPIETSIHVKVGASVWGKNNDTPSTKIAELMNMQSKNLGIIESFTGGMIASTLLNSGNNSGFFKGSWVIPDLNSMNDIPGSKFIDAVSDNGAEFAKELAQRARSMFGTEVGIGVPSPKKSLAGDSSGTVFAAYVNEDTGTVISSHHANLDDRTRHRVVTQIVLGLIEFLK